MLFNEKYDYMVSCRNKTKKSHKNHMKISPRTRIWYKKEIILKRKRHKAKKKLKRYKKKLQYIDKYRKRIKRLQNEINELHVSSNKDVDTMYNSLENIATCSNHSSVQHFLRQSINAYVREQPNRFHSSLTHVWAYDNSSKDFNITDKKIEDCQTKMDTTRIKLSIIIKELE